MLFMKIIQTKEYNTNERIQYEGKIRAEYTVLSERLSRVFKLVGTVDPHNCTYWATMDLHVVQEHHIDLPRITGS